MKKLILSLLLIPAFALAQSYPTPTFNSLSLQTPLTPANGGTGTTSATGTGSVVRSSSPTIASPTITGSLSASGATFSGGISANGVTSTSNFVGPNAYSIYTSTGINNGGGIQVFDASHGNYVGILNNGTTVGQFGSYGATIGSSVYPTIVAPINTTATTTNGSANITVTSAAGITTGMGVYGSFTGGCSGPSAAFQQSYVTAISGTTVTMSCASTATNSSPVAVQFGQQRYSTTSTLIASDLGAQTLKVGAASQGNSSAWLNQVSGGNDYRLTAAAQIVAPPSGGYGLVVGSRSSDATGGAAAFPIASFLYLDSWGNSEYGSENLYLQDNLLAATAGKGPHIQFEQSINSQWGSPPSEDPYNINQVNQTIGHRYDCGTGQSTTSGLNGCTSAIDIVPNPQTFENGIVVANGALDTGGGTRQASVISMPTMTGFTWFSAPSTFSSAVYSPSAGVLYSLVPAGGQFNNIVNGNTVTTINSTGLTVNGLITPSSTSGIKGTIVGDNANAGSVGEFVNSNFSSVSMTTSGTAQNLTSISLTAGDWDVTGAATYTSGSGATQTIWLAGVNTTSATLPSLGSYFQSGGSITATGAASAIPPVTRINVSSTTTVYLVGESVFSGGSVTASGFLRARRVR
ncbi:gp19 domain protein [Burkholderia gladioli]|uniref:Gp19 domain protein n=1 Tax=Burkholderia gladioli TaxID=28095 RepID=A0AAW3EZW2_BURGA|nr:hypothetical protein [Burkholderia gladioli]KGC13706.1 gp19 domain protein [Burkholderia gladioli]